MPTTPRQVYTSPQVAVASAYTSRARAIATAQEWLGVDYLASWTTGPGEPSPRDVEPNTERVWTGASGGILLLANGVASGTVWVKDPVVGWVAVADVTLQPFRETAPVPVRYRPVFLQRTDQSSGAVLVRVGVLE